MLEGLDGGPWGSIAGVDPLEPPMLEVISLTENPRAVPLKVIRIQYFLGNE